MANKQALGKGLGALISPPALQSGEGVSGVIEADIRRIEPNARQPRQYYEEDSLRELAESIKQYGVIQPLIVKEEADGSYSIIAGERRYRAARLAKLATVPIIIRDYGESEQLQIALIENIQRQDLNPIEEAQCFKRLADEYFYTPDDIAEKISKSRSTVVNALSLLELDSQVQRLVIYGQLAVSHARMLLAVTDVDRQYRLAKQAAEEKLSLKELEKLIKRLSDPERASSGDLKKSDTEHRFRHMENSLRDVLGTKVNIKDTKGKGKIEIEYYSPGDLDRLLSMIKTL